MSERLVREADVSVYVVETATIYRAGGRRFFSRDAAIRRFARVRFFAKHPCECEQEDCRLVFHAHVSMCAGASKEL